MRHLTLGAILFVLAGVGPAVQAQTTDPQMMAPINKFIDAFNKGDMAGAAATHASEADLAIIDEVPPFLWRGAEAFKAWGADLDRDAKKQGITDPKVSIAAATRVEMDGDAAYVVVPAVYTFKQAGVAMRESRADDVHAEERRGRLADPRLDLDRPETAEGPEEYQVSEQEEDFAAMFEASVKARQFDRGQTIEGTIVAFGPKVAFVDVGGKGEAEIDLAELKDADGDVEVSIGDRIQAMVVSTSGGIVLSRRGVRNAATQRELEDAFQAGLAVEGKVDEGRQGRLRGAHRPRARVLSVLADRHRPHRGPGGARRADLRVPHHRVQGRRERRRRLPAQAPRGAAARGRRGRAQVDRAGAVLTGRVVSVPAFGAFVDLGGGIQGLLHVSDMSWSRVANPSEIVAPGDQITVKVLRVDEATQKISLGLKQLLDDPWTTVATTYEVGQVRTGRVTRVADFGAFVELEPGIEALAHASTFAPTGRSGRVGEGVGRRLDRRVRDPQHRPRAEAHRRRARRRGIVACRRGHVEAR